MCSSRFIFFMFLYGLLSSCMYYPAFENDYSSMRSDFFSQLVIDWSTGNQAYPMDDVGMSKASHEYFDEYSLSMLQKFFEERSGKCEKSKDGVSVYYCEVTRRWRMENVGAKIDMSKVCIPGMKMVFEFSFLGHPSGEQAWTSLKTYSWQDNACPY